MEHSRSQTKNYQNKIIKQIEALPDKPYRLFSPDENNILIKYYPTKGANQLAKILGKTSTQVSSRAQKLGLKRSRIYDI